MLDLNKLKPGDEVAWRRPFGGGTVNLGSPSEAVEAILATIGVEPQR